MHLLDIENSLCSTCLIYSLCELAGKFALELFVGANTIVRLILEFCNFDFSYDFGELIKELTQNISVSSSIEYIILNKKKWRASQWCFHCAQCIVNAMPFCVHLTMNGRLSNYNKNRIKLRRWFRDASNEKKNAKLISWHIHCVAMTERKNWMSSNFAFRCKHFVSRLIYLHSFWICTERVSRVNAQLALPVRVFGAFVCRL